jgi:hypothetical protein
MLFVTRLLIHCLEDPDYRLHISWSDVIKDHYQTQFQSHLLVLWVPGFYPASKAAGASVCVQPYQTAFSFTYTHYEIKASLRPTWLFVSAYVPTCTTGYWFKSPSREGLSARRFCVVYLIPYTQIPRVSQNRPRPVPFTSSPMHYSPPPHHSTLTLLSTPLKKPPNRLVRR